MFYEVKQNEKITAHTVKLRGFLEAWVANKLEHNGRATELYR